MLKLQNSLKFCSFASGSSGNCYLIKSDDTALLVDAGISAKKTFERLEKAGLVKEEVKGLLLTHGHDDHIKSLHTIAKKINECKIYCTSKTWKCLDKFDDESRTVIIEKNSEFTVGDIRIKSFSLSHDIEETVGYSFYKEGKQISIVTDTGHISEEVFEEIKEADVLIIEANHEVQILEVGHYPYFIKRRILSDVGHLSNEACGKCVAKIASVKDKHRTVLLAHLSKDNNTDYHARITVENHLLEEGINLEKDVTIEVLGRDEPSQLF